MAQIDSWLKVLDRRPGAEIHVAVDAEPRLVRAHGASRALFDRKLAAAQIRFLLGEIAPEEATGELESAGGTEFTYRADGHDPVVVTIQDWRGDVAARIRSAAPAGEADVPGEPPRPAAPAEPAAARKTAVTTTGGAPGAGEPPINALFRRMIRLHASDLHLSTGERPMVRKDGDIRRIEEHPPLTHAGLTSLLEPIMPAKARREYEETHDTDFAYEIPGLSRFRANVFRDRKGICAVFRVIPTEIVTAEKLGLSPAVQNLCFLSKGLVLVTGPTGSGKSTTLCALVDLVNRKRKDHVITIEDPIEFVHENKGCLINQREVGGHTQGFKRALRAALREDPDIILVGELRDLETIAIAIETAETGHLVFGTLHTSTAASTVDRIIDQFPADRQQQIRVMLSESLKAVISQSLCKKNGGGRVAAMEVLLVNHAVSNLIREAKTFQIPSVMQTARKQGMVLLNDALMDLVLAGQVEAKEAYIKAIDKGGFTGMCKAANISLDFLQQVT